MGPFIAEESESQMQKLQAEVEHQDQLGKKSHNSRRIHSSVTICHHARKERAESHHAIDREQIINFYSIMVSKSIHCDQRETEDFNWSGYARSSKAKVRK